MFILFFFLLSFCYNSRLISSTEIQQKPNFVIVLADDLDNYATPAYFPLVMPFLDSLIKQGISFSNSFVPSSVCCPSRAALLSGKYGHKTGVLNNGGEYGGWEQFIDDEPFALPAILSNNGYRTAIIGKYLNGFDFKKNKSLAIPYGWTDGALHISPRLQPYKGYDYKLLHWEKGNTSHNNTWQAEKYIMQYGSKPEHYSTDVLTQEAIQFLNESANDNSRPFFLLLTPTAPHFPIPPAPRHAQQTLINWEKNLTPNFPNTFNDKGKLAMLQKDIIPYDKPWWLRKTWKKRLRQSNKGRGLYNFLFPYNVPNSIKSYRDADWFNRMGSLYALDDMVRAIEQTLKNNKQWENTIFIFTSDNGYQFGNHGLYQKSTPYEESIRVPLIITGGTKFNLKKGVLLDHWIANIDIMPTILDIADITIPDDVDGISFKKLLINNTENSDYTNRSKLLLEYNGPGMAGYWSKRYRLHFFVLPSYHSDIPSYRAIRIKLFDDHNRETVFKYIEWIRYPRLDKLKIRYESNDPKLMMRLKSGNKHLARKVQKSLQTEPELYMLNDDPYELDNLLYYEPEKYKTVAEQLKKELYNALKVSP